MTSRLALIASAIFILTTLTGCDRSESRQVAALSVEEAKRMSSDIANLRAQTGTIVAMLCRQRCENNYNTCVMAAVARDLQNRIPGGPDRGPGKVELPGCWPYACSDDEQRQAVKDPMPNCAKARDACLAACPALS